MRKNASNLLLALGIALTGGMFAQAGVVFGTGVNQFTIDFVEIGNPGNADDTTGIPNPAGRVDYVYQIGKYEVSEDMITKYNAEFGTANGLAITLANMSGDGGNGADKPATGVSWNEAARFVNWLNTSQGYQAAYKFTTSGVNDNIVLWTIADLGFDSANPFRNSLAQYFLPSYDEWFKAAYYDPTANGGTGGYWDFPTGSDAAPTAVASGTNSGTAVYGQPNTQGPAIITQAGGLSPYGVMGLGGNVFEWEESALDLVNSESGEVLGVRGGSWSVNSSSLSSSMRDGRYPSFESISVGFRVASRSSPEVVPEPASMALWGSLGLMGLLGYRRARN
jgi:formylglycine-generating enzyme required for sulfatase activity